MMAGVLGGLVPYLLRVFHHNINRGGHKYYSENSNNHLHYSLATSHDVFRVIRPHALWITGVLLKFAVWIGLLLD
jgi:hypothetical protein